MNINRLGLLLAWAVLFMAGWEPLAAQNISVTGKVTDGSEALPGVTIIVEGTSSGTTSKANGDFSLTAPADGTMVFSFLGYETLRVPVNNRTNILVSMTSSSTGIDEVVVVGYGTMRKRDVTGSITSIGSSEIQKNQPVDLADALQSKVAGLEILTNSEPGSVSSFRIRGTATLSEGGSNPLFIVDGMEIDDITSINPRDIASIEILKDAASAAIYGSKSANGVIIVTTKQGESEKSRIDISYSHKISQVSRKLPQMNRLEGYRYEDLRDYLQGREPTTHRDSLNPLYLGENYYQDLMFRTANTDQIDVSISGAEKKLKYFLSGGYLNDQGIQLNTFNKRLSTRVNVDYRANNKLSVGSRLYASYMRQRQAPYSSRQEIFRRGAHLTVYEPDGSYTPVMQGRNNPLAMTMLGPNDYKIFSVNANEYVEYRILPQLRFRASISGSLMQRNLNNYNPALLDRSQIAKSTNTNSTRYSWVHDDVLTYSKTFNKSHDFTAMAGFSIEETGTDQTSLWVTGNLTDAVPISNIYSEVDATRTQATWTGNRMASFFGRLSYSYLGRYLFNANLRYDGSSRFGRDRRWGFFPSVSAGWRFSDEGFMKWTKPFLADGKIRVSYGQTGNQSVDNFAGLNLYTTNMYADYRGVLPLQLENNELGWEKISQINAGLDLSMLNSRINVAVDFYNKETSGVLYRINLPQTSGFSSSYRNIGNVNNRGIEFTVNSVNIVKNDFEWSTMLNLTFNKNEITSIPPGGQTFINGVYIIDSGYSLGTMYGFKRMQVFQYDQSNAFDENWNQLTSVFDNKGRFLHHERNGVKYEGTVNQLRYNSPNGYVYKGGDVMWEDINKDGVIDDEDRQVIGNGQPKVMGAVGTDIRFKGFTLSALFAFSAGGDVYNAYERDRSGGTTSSAVKPNPVVIANSWQAPGDIAYYPVPHNTSTNGNYRVNSDIWIEDGSYIRLKNIRLSYKFPDKWTGKLGLRDINVFVMMQNYLTWTNYTGFDPELIPSGFALGYDNNSYPKAKDILFGLNFNF